MTWSLKHVVAQKPMKQRQGDVTPDDREKYISSPAAVTFQNHLSSTRYKSLWELSPSFTTKNTIQILLLLNLTIKHHGKLCFKIITTLNCQDLTPKIGVKMNYFWGWKWFQNGASMEKNSFVIRSLRNWCLIHFQRSSIISREFKTTMAISALEKFNPRA